VSIKLNQLCSLDESGVVLLELGLQPVSNRFFPYDSLDQTPRYPLSLNLCMESGLVHQRTPFPVAELKPQHNWLTCFEPEDHLDGMVETIKKLPGITKESVVGAYSFKDKSTLERLNNKGYKNIWCIDPKIDLGIEDDNANIETYQLVLEEKVIANILKRNGAADLFIIRHVIEHAYNLPVFIELIKKLIKPGGYIVWELPDCERALSIGDCTMIWEEHIFYFTTVTFKQLLYASGFEIVHFESIRYPLENSIIAIVKEATGDYDISEFEKSVIEREIERAQNYSNKIFTRSKDIRKKLMEIKNEYGPVAIFGAGHLTSAFLSILDVSDLIHCVIDDNPNKIGMKMPGCNLKIVSSEILYSNKIRSCLVGINPQNVSSLMSSHKKFIDDGGVFGSIFPDVDLGFDLFS